MDLLELRQGRLFGNFWALQCWKPKPQYTKRQKRKTKNSFFTQILQELIWFLPLRWVLSIEINYIDFNYFNFTDIWLLFSSKSYTRIRKVMISILSFFLFWMDKCKIPGFDRHKLYFMNHSHFTNCIVDSFKFKYSLDIYLDDDHDAILSRIFYLQKREQSSIIIIIFIDNLIQKVKTTFKIATKIIQTKHKLFFKTVDTSQSI